MWFVTHLNEPVHHTTRTLSLRLPTSQGNGDTTVSPGDPKIREVLDLVDRTLVSAGLVRDTNQPPSGGLGPNGDYFKYDASHLISGGASVYFRNNRLEVIFVENGNRTGRLGADTQKICDQLQSELASRYGPDKVKVEN